MPAADTTLLEAFSAGTLRFAYGVSPWLFIAAAALLTALVWLGYSRTTRPLSGAWRGLFVALRSAALVLILFCLLRPVVVDQETVPQETFFAVLVDTSKSMTIADTGAGRSRLALAQEALRTRLLDELGTDFQVRVFGFGGAATRAATLDALEAVSDETAFSASSTAIGGALDAVTEQLSGLPLSGMLLLSDGSDNSGIDPDIAARALASAGIPLYTLGVGQTALPRDLGVTSVATSETILEGSVFTAQVSLDQQGFDGQGVRLSVSEGGREVVSREVILGSSDVPQRFDLEVAPEREEAILYDLEVELLDPELTKQEIIRENNRYQFLVDNSPQPALDILFIEGHPRNEYKFIQRAIRGDDSLRLATYLRTGPEKFYRQGIQSPTELSAGFPRERDELFEYEAIILGDIEQDFFDAEQLALLDDFVAERGGGLLLSGRVDEGFIGTPLADIAPVSLVEESFLPQSLQGGIRRGDHLTGSLFSPRLTQAGRVSPLLRLAADDSANRNAWAQLPPLQGVYVSGRTKPGASVLLEHPTLDYQNQPLPVIVSQRYGSGRSMLVATASTWRWQMMLPVADQSQEKLWRQLLRWLAVSAGERLTLSFDREFYHLGDTVRVEAAVVDARFEPDNDATLWLRQEDPLGAISETPMQWQLEEDGVYRAEFVASQEGVYDLLVDVASAAGEGREQNSEKRASLVVTPSLREYRDAALDEGVLQRLAATTGGSYAPLAEADALVSKIRNTPNAYSKEVITDLWNNPWLLGLLILLLCVDWTLRRSRGLS